MFSVRRILLLIMEPHMKALLGGSPLHSCMYVRKYVCMSVCMYVYIPSHPAAKHTHINRKYVFMSVYVYM